MAPLAKLAQNSEETSLIVPKRLLTLPTDPSPLDVTPDLETLSKLSTADLKLEISIFLVSFVLFFFNLTSVNKLDSVTCKQLKQPRWSVM